MPGRTRSSAVAEASMTESPTAVTWPPATPCGPRRQAGSDDDEARGEGDRAPDARGAPDTGAGAMGTRSWTGHSQGETAPGPASPLLASAVPSAITGQCHR